MFQFLEGRQQIRHRPAPSGPVATPVPDRSRGGGLPPAVSHVLPAWPLRSSPRELAEQSSIRAVLHTPAWLAVAWAASADRSWRHGRRGQPATFSPAFVAGQKRGQIWLSERPVLWALDEIRSTRPQWILFGQAGFIIRQPVAVARGNSRASITLGWQPGPDGAAAAQSGNRTS